VRVNPLTFATRSRIDQAPKRGTLRTHKTCIPQPNGLRGEEDPALAEFFFEDLILGTEALDDFSLPAVSPTSEEGEQELPGLANEDLG
jgi:hypothetical protein